VIEVDEKKMLEALKKALIDYGDNAKGRRKAKLEAFLKCPQFKMIYDYVGGAYEVYIIAEKIFGCETEACPTYLMYAYLGINYDYIVIHTREE